MVEHNELTQDEQMYPGLTKQIQENYPIDQADQQSLQRIRSRIQQAHMVSIQQNRKQESMRAGQFVHPPVQRLTSRPTNPWRWRIGALAVLLVIALVAGTFISLNAQKATKIAKSTEVTKTAVVAPVKNQPSLMQIDMTSATIGWGEAISTEATDDMSHQRVIARTLDGGKSWNEIHLPAPYTTYITAFFLDGTTAWVIPGSSLDTSGTPLIRTLDGGKTWEKFMIPGGTSEITFADHLNGWATDVSLPAPDAGMNQERAIYHTADGGKTWTQISVAQAGTTYTTPGPFPSGEVGQGIFLNSQIGWFVRGTVITEGHGSTYQALFITQDGGKSWQLQQLPQSGEIIPSPDVDSSNIVAYISIPKFFDAQHGNVFVYESDQDNVHIYMYNTADGGQTWQLAGNKFSEVRDKNVKGPILMRDIDATHFILTKNGEVDTYALVGGQWQEEHKTVINGVTSYDDGYFVNRQTGWLVANHDVIVDKVTNDKTYTSSIYKTSDGGKSWQKIQQSSYVIPESATQGG
jgi:photosystem II stability/assembly factor-like uncharacterized protein